MNMQTFRKTIGAMLASIVLLFSVATIIVPSTASATDAKGQVCDSIGGCDASGSKVADALRAVINLLSAIGGIIAVIMIVIGGFKYMTSGGDANGAASARNTILYAIVGLIIVAFAQIIVRFVLQRIL